MTSPLVPPAHPGDVTARSADVIASRVAAAGAGDQPEDVVPTRLVDVEGPRADALPLEHDGRRQDRQRAAAGISPQTAHLLRRGIERERERSLFTMSEHQGRLRHINDGANAP